MDNIKTLTNPKTFELFYYNFRSAIMKNNKKDIDFYKKLIKSSIDYDKNIINSLDDYKKDQLIQLIHYVKNGIVPYSFNSAIDYENDIDEIICKEKYTMVEKDLNRTIFEGYLPKISEIINRKLTPIMTEHPIYEGYEVDITSKDLNEKEFWIIELKSESADHKIIGQCIKYIQYFEDRLIYKLYDKVRALTICGGYRRIALSELKKMGIITLKYENVCGSLSFEKV